MLKNGYDIVSKKLFFITRKQLWPLRRLLLKWQRFSRNGFWITFTMAEHELETTTFEQF